MFKTPCSTPRRLRRSISQGDLDSPTPSPLLRRSSLLRGDEEETEVKSLRARLLELETEKERLTEEQDTLKSAYNSAVTELHQAKTTIEELTAQKEDLDRLRNSDMEMCLALREKLAKAEEDVEKGESAIR